MGREGVGKGEVGSQGQAEGQWTSPAPQALGIGEAPCDFPLRR